MNPAGPAARQGWPLHLTMITEELPLRGGRRLQVTAYVGNGGPIQVEIAAGMEMDVVGVLVGGDRLTLPPEAVPELIGALQRAMEAKP